MKPRFETPTSSDLITALIVIALFAVPLLLMLFVNSALPETMIGADGLRQTHAFFSCAENARCVRNASVSA